MDYILKINYNSKSKKLLMNEYTTISKKDFTRKNLHKSILDLIFAFHVCH